MTRVKRAVSEGFLCPDCGAAFSTPRGAGLHRRRAHGAGPDHGTHARYSKGCRCEPCRDAHASYQRGYKRRLAARPMDGSPESLRACLLAFGVEPWKLAEALKTRTIEDLHWGAWCSSGDLRKHCRCEVPREIAEELREAS